MQPRDKMTELNLIKMRNPGLKLLPPENIYIFYKVGSIGSNPPVYQCNGDLYGELSLKHKFQWISERKEQYIVIEEAPPSGEQPKITIYNLPERAFPVILK